MRRNSTGLYYLKNILVAILIVLIFCCSFLAIANFTFYHTHTQERVKGYSMLPTLNSNVESDNILGDTIYVSTTAKIRLNDIVIASPEWHDKLIIKRLVGLPGDKIQIKNVDEHFELYINDKLLYTRNKYLENGAVDYSGTYSYYQKFNSFLTDERFSEYVETENGESYIKLDEDEYFLMGDNWGHTLDSLSEGPVSRKEIIAKTCLIIEYGKNHLIETTKHILKEIFSFD